MSQKVTNMEMWVMMIILSLSAMLWITSAQSSPIVFHVSEELPSGTLVGNVKDASNISQAVNSSQADSLQFQILSADGLRITSIFSINSRTGAIFTNAMINREQICERAKVCQLEFDVTVTSGVDFFRLLTVRVIVDDVNDNAPAFPRNEITLSVPESSPPDSEIPISGALDHDTGINVSIRYSLQVSSVFGLKEVKQLDGSSALKLIVQRPLDREAVPAYSFLILASDGQGPDSLTGTLTVDVKVTDVNDNEPTFSKKAFNFTVMETAPVGTVFGHLTASDDDVGENGELSYRFSLLTQSDVTQLFSLNTTSGELVVASGLQYESGKSFQCVVEVMDHGVPPQVSQAILRVHVADAGNTPPKLGLTLADPLFGDQSAMLYEDVRPGTFVGTLKVEDLDEGDEGKVSCSSANPSFSLQDVDTNSYGIVVSRGLDRERQQELSVTLLCSDSGSPPLTASTVFSVIVRDVNDNAPVFTKRVYEASVTENVVGAQSVMTVSASDRDDSTNSVVSYSLDSQSGQFFAIDSTSGLITTRHSFDREMTPQVTMTVYAVDSGKPPLTGSAFVTVSVADVNDNVPYVNRTDFYASEGTPVGHVAFHVSAADEDVGENGSVTVSSLTVSGGQDGVPSPFSVLSNGSVVIRTRLDREVQALYTLPVVLADGGNPPLSSSTTLTVRVVDNNDYTPTFLFPIANNRTVHIGADVPAGSTVCQIVATDNDMGKNGQVTYAILSESDGRHPSPVRNFGLNNKTGQIFVARALASVRGTVIRLNVSASDQGRPPLTSTSYLDVYVDVGNGTYLPAGGGDHGDKQEDRYVIIAGVIAGVTFIIAVVVIAVIVHMRNSDLRRRANARAAAGKDSGMMMGDECVADNAKNLSVLSSKKNHHMVVGSAGGGGGGGDSGGVLGGGGGMKSNNGVTAFDGEHNLSLDNGGFEPHSPQPDGTRGRTDHPAGEGSGDGILTEDALDHFNPAFSLFPEARNRFVSEDRNSESSGETTTCDSGRGASDEEIVYPLTGNPTVNGFRDPPPRLPPREPLSCATSGAGQWSRDACVVSTNWSHLDSPHYGGVGDDPMRYVVSSEEPFDVHNVSSSSPAAGAGDFRPKSSSSSNSSRKGPLKVRFSFDGSDPQSSQSALYYPVLNAEKNRGYPGDLNKLGGFDSNGQPYIPPGAPQYERSVGGVSANPNHYHHHNSHQQQRQQQPYNPNSNSAANISSHPATGDPQQRLRPESMYPKLDRFPRKHKAQSSHSEWDRQHAGGKARNSESLTSLSQSVDDDASTTTSGSYSIDVDDHLTNSTTI